jgi:hypothetical protein
MWLVGLGITGSEITYARVGVTSPGDPFG